MAIDLGVTIKQLIDEINSFSVGKTNTSVMPNNGGDIKTKYRMSNKGYTYGENWYFPICKLPIDNAGNYASAIISGRIGGWQSNNMSYINALVWNRDTTDIALINIAGSATAMSSVWSRSDLVIYDNSDNSSTLYVKCNNYYTFDLDLELFQSGATILYDGSHTNTTPSGTLMAQTSTSTKRVEIVNGKLLINGLETAKTSDIPTKTSQLTNDSGFTTNKGTVTQVKVNGTTKSPDSTGLVDLGTISGGGGSSYTFVEDVSKTYIKYKGTEFGANGNGFNLLGTAIVDWGDGTIDNYDDTNLYPTHTYTDGNTYHLISISGDIDWTHHPFYGDSYIEELTIPNTVNNDYTTTFGELDSVCYDCENLKIVKMQATTPPKINGYCFLECPSLEKIIVPKSAWSAYKEATNWSNFANKIVYLTDSSDLLFSYQPVYIKANTGIKRNGDYNINVTILSGLDTLRVGDRIQVCMVKTSKSDNHDGTYRIRKRLRCIKYYEISGLDTSGGDAVRRQVYSIDMQNTAVGTGVGCRDTLRTSGTKRGSYLRRPLSVRIVRCPSNAWEIETALRKPLSNIVQLGTSKDAVIPL